MDPFKGRGSPYTTGSQALNTVLFHVGDRFAGAITMSEAEALRACLWSLAQAHYKAGVEEGRRQVLAEREQSLDEAADKVAQEKLQWVLDNWGNLDTED